MKKVISMICIVFGMSACQKDTTPGTVENATPNVITQHDPVVGNDSSIYVHLVVADYFTQTYTKYYKRNNLIGEGGQIGYVYYVGDPNGDNITLIVYFTGVIDLSGNYNGHSWIVYNGFVNVCNGPQGMEYTLVYR